MVPGLRVAGKALSAFLLLLGLLAVCIQVDMTPWVGDALIDVFTWEDLNAPAPAYFYRLVPFLGAGVGLAVMSVVGLLGRFPPLVSVAALLRCWSFWALASMLLKAALMLMGWRHYEAAELLRVMVLNGVTSATVLTIGLWLFGLYAAWRARPRKRWGEAALWFGVTSVLLVGFSVAINLLGGLSSERLVSDTWQMALVFGGLLGLAAALTPRPATPSRPGGTRTPNQTVMSGRL